jgi:hypothetical protein
MLWVPLPKDYGTKIPVCALRAHFFQKKKKIKKGKELESQF